MLLGRGEQHGEEERDEEEERPLTGVTLGGDQQELLRARHAHRPAGNTATRTAAESQQPTPTLQLSHNNRCHYSSVTARFARCTYMNIYMCLR